MHTSSANIEQKRFAIHEARTGACDGDEVSHLAAVSCCVNYTHKLPARNSQLGV